MDADQYAEGERLPGLLVFRFDAPLFFANSARFRDRLELMLLHNPGDERWVVLDFEGVGAVDATALDTLAAMVDDFGARGIVLAVARANERALAPLRRAGLLDDGELRVYATIRQAVRAFEAARAGA